MPSVCYTVYCRKTKESQEGGQLEAEEEQQGRRTGSQNTKDVKARP